MLIEARKLCGDHIGSNILVRVIVEDNRYWDAEAKEYKGENIYGMKYIYISMITHKKNGDVNVRTGYGERSYAADELVTLDE